MTSSLLEAKGITKSFCHGVKVLDGASLSVESGESLAIVGESGSGKSTLLKICALIAPPDSGEVIVYGKSASALGDGERAAIRASTFGFVFQDHRLLSGWNVIENVLSPVWVHPKGVLSKQQATQRATELLERVGLKGFSKRKVETLSGGEAQRVCIARALMLSPKVLFADEPTGSLDERNASEVASILFETASQEAGALVMVTHSSTLAKRANRVITLRGGVCISQ